MRPTADAVNDFVSNKTSWTSKEILEATKGQAIGQSSSWVATGATVYSFKVQPGDLFILLSHHKTRIDFVQEAFQKGAAGTLLTCTENYPLEVTASLSAQDLRKCIFVENSNAALTAFGIHASRLNTACKKIAITGSVGKTSTKEGLAQILTKITVSHHKRIYCNYLNENNEVGVALSLIKMPRNGQVDYCIFELGISNPNEMRTLVSMVQPSLVIITKIAEAHLESFKNMEELVDAKCEIFETNLNSDGSSRNVTAILNRDDEFYPRVLSHATKNKISHIVTFGEHPDSTLQLVRFDMDCDLTRVTVKHNGELYNYSVGQPGKAWMWNSLAILAAVRCLIPSAVTEAMDELKNLSSVTGRGASYEVSFQGSGEVGRRHITLIDDSYNASPTAMKCGLEMLGLTNRNDRAEIQRKIAVLGDMLELGSENEIQYHLSLKPVLEANQIDLVFACGPLMNRLYETLDASMKGGTSASDSTELISQLMDTIQHGDVVYVKGSRGMQMDKIVSALLSFSLTRQ